MIRRRKVVVGSLGMLIALFIFGACSTNSKDKDTAASSEKLKVVVTNSILADITENIAKDKTDLHSIVPIRKDPHEYKLLPEDVRKTPKADLIFYNGVNLETGGSTWFIKLVKNTSKEENKDYSAASDGIDVICSEGQSEKRRENPHVWLNLENGIIYAKNIEKQLTEKDPDNKKFYKENLDRYIKKLDSLDKEAKSKFASISNDKKMIVTNEGCLKYFLEAYNMSSAYIWEVNTEEEGAPDQIKHLVEKSRTTEVPSLFVEGSMDDRPMKAVSKDTNVPIYSTIFTDSVAEKGQDGDSYYTMMKWNLDKIVEGLSK